MGGLSWTFDSWADGTTDAEQVFDAPLTPASFLAYYRPTGGSTGTGTGLRATYYASPDYTNPVLTRTDRVANLRTKRTALDSLAHVPKDERITVYGDVALYSTLLTLSGRYSGEAEQGQFRALVVWIRRDDRWQQLASQMTPVVAP